MRLAAVLLALALPVQAATITIPTTATTINIESAIDCNDGSALVCITTLETQRAYLLGVVADDKFVAAAYSVLLRRPVDAAGLSYYTNRLIGKTITRDGVIHELMASPEYKN